MVAGMRSLAKAMELPPEPNVRAPALDPTREEARGEIPWADSTFHPGANEPRSDVGGCFEDGFRPGRSCLLTEERFENAEKRSARGRRAQVSSSPN